MKKITVVEVARKHQLFIDETDNKRLIYAGEIVKSLYVKTFERTPPLTKVKENSWVIKVRCYPPSFEPIILRCLQDYERFKAGEKIQEIKINLKSSQKPVIRVMRQRKKYTQNNSIV